MAKKADLLEQAKKLGLEVTEKNTIAEIEAAIKSNDDLIREKIGIQKGSGTPHTEKVGKITRAQLEEIYEEKKDTLNAIDVDGGVKVIAGTARSMGVEVEG